MLVINVLEANKEHHGKKTRANHRSVCEQAEWNEALFRQKPPMDWKQSQEDASKKEHTNYCGGSPCIALIRRK